MDRLTAHIDLMPTILEACAAAPPAGVKLDGTSLLPLLRNPAAAWPDRTLFFQWDSGQVPRRGHAFAVRSRQWKLVQPTGMDHPQPAAHPRPVRPALPLQGRGHARSRARRAIELYAIDKDPGETKDLAAAHPDLVAQMKTQYEDWFDDVCARLAPHGAAASKPNVIFFLTDDQRWDALGCCGNRIVQTPEMDRLAAEGTLFRNAFVTSSICAASRASIFTGTYERFHHCNFNTGYLKRSLLQKSYPMLLRQAGYYTGFIGKYGVGDGKPDIEGREIFDRWFGFYGQGTYFPKEHPRQAPHRSHDRAGRGVPRRRAGRPALLPASELQVAALGQGLSWATSRSRRLRPLYADVTIPYPPTARQEYFDALPEFLRRCNARTNYWQQRYGTPEQYQAVMKDYYRLITGADRAIGRIRGELARRGLAENTVILFFSDNGDMTSDYMLGGKEPLYDVSLRVPLIVRDPRVARSARGQKRSELALNIDLAPTVLDLAGVARPPVMQGRSLMPLVRGEQASWRGTSSARTTSASADQYYPMIEGVRTTQWKYVRYPEMNPVYEQLFELDRDPQELRDLARTPEFSERLSQLRKRCEELRGEAAGQAVARTKP